MLHSGSFGIDFRADLRCGSFGFGTGNLQREVSEAHWSARPRRCTSGSTSAMCKAAPRTLPGATQRRPGVEWWFECRNYCVHCLGKAVTEEATSGKQKIGDPRKCALLLGVPLRLLCRRIWGGLCVGKSRARAPGRRDRLLGDTMGEIFGAASRSSCSEALAAFTSPQAEHPCVHGDGVKRRAPGWRSQTCGCPGRLSYLVAVKGTKSLTHSAAGNVPLSLAVRDLPYSEAGWRELCEGFKWNESLCPSLTFGPRAQRRWPKEALAGSALTGLGRSSLASEGSNLLFPFSRGIRSKQNHSCANAEPQRILVNMKQMLQA